MMLEDYDEEAWIDAATDPSELCSDPQTKVVWEYLGEDAANSYRDDSGLFMKDLVSILNHVTGPDDKADILFNLFTWSDTPQGRNYWREQYGVWKYEDEDDVYDPRWLEGRKEALEKILGGILRANPTTPKLEDMI